MGKIDWKRPVRTVHTQEHGEVLTTERPDDFYPIVCMLGPRVLFFTPDGDCSVANLPVENVPDRRRFFRNLYSTGRVGASFDTIEEARSGVHEDIVERCTGQIELLFVDGIVMHAVIHIPDGKWHAEVDDGQTVMGGNRRLVY